jgi:hypothetical protein
MTFVLESFLKFAWRNFWLNRTTLTNTAREDVLFARGNDCGESLSYLRYHSHSENPCVEMFRGESLCYLGYHGCSGNSQPDSHHTRKFSVIMTSPIETDNRHPLTQRSLIPDNTGSVRNYQRSNLSEPVRTVTLYAHSLTCLLYEYARSNGKCFEYRSMHMKLLRF